MFTGIGEKAKEEEDRKIREGRKEERMTVKGKRTKGEKK